MNILAIDVGTTSMRGILYDQNGNEIYSESRLTPLIYSGSYIEQDPLKLKEKLYEILREINKRHRIDAISLTAFRSSPVMLDKNGDPLSNFIM